MYELNQQTRNFLEVYSRNPIQTILNALKMQSPKIINELKEYFNVDNLNDLAEKIHFNMIF